MFGLETREILRHHDLERAAKLAGAGRLAEAFEMARRFSAKNPGLASGHIFESGVAEMLGRHDLTLAACRRSADIQTPAPEVCFRAILAALHVADEAAAVRFLALATPQVLEPGGDLNRLWEMFAYTSQVFQPPVPPMALPALPGQPLISVIMPTANRPLLLADALDSLLAQTYPHWEAIVVNASPDPIELPVSDPRIRLVDSRQALSAARARNLGLDLISGELYCFLDDDDLFRPDHFKVALAALRDGKYAAVYTDSETVFEDISSGRRVVLKRERTQEGRSWMPLFMQLCNNIFIHEMLYRRDCCGHLRFDTELAVFEDWDFLMGFPASLAVGRAPQVTCEVRKRAGPNTDHVSHNGRNVLATCNAIYARHPAARPWIEVGRRVYQRVMGMR